MIISGCEILRWENPTTGYDHRITTSPFLSFAAGSCRKSTESETGIIFLRFYRRHYIWTKSMIVQYLKLKKYLKKERHRS